MHATHMYIIASEMQLINAYMHSIYRHMYIHIYVHIWANKQHNAVNLLLLLLSCSWNISMLTSCCKQRHMHMRIYYICIYVYICTYLHACECIHINKVSLYYIYIIICMYVHRYHLLSVCVTIRCYANYYVNMYAYVLICDIQQESYRHTYLHFKFHTNNLHT